MGILHVCASIIKLGQIVISQTILHWLKANSLKCSLIREFTCHINSSKLAQFCKRRQNLTKYTVSAGAKLSVLTIMRAINGHLACLCQHNKIGPDCDFSNNIAFVTSKFTLVQSDQGIHLSHQFIKTGPSLPARSEACTDLSKQLGIYTSHDKTVTSYTHSSFNTFYTE